MTLGQNTTRPAATERYVAILRRDPCAYCGAPADTNRFGQSDIDHIYPRCLGGVDRGMNMTATCASCNSSKGTATLLGFLLWRRYEPERLEAEAALRTINSMRKSLGGLRSVGL